MGPWGSNYYLGARCNKGTKLELANETAVGTACWRVVQAEENLLGYIG